ncbi:hypothetical protein ACTXT7_011779 [Hymenolepis weldensis]
MSPDQFGGGSHVSLSESRRDDRHVQIDKHTAGPPVDTAVEILSPPEGPQGDISPEGFSFADVIIELNQKSTDLDPLIVEFRQVHNINEATREESR